MFKFLRRLIKNQSGQAMVELAITLPVLLLILCSIVDFGWFLSNQLTLSYCSREGARYGIIYAKDADAVQNITNHVLTISPDYLKDDISVSVTFSNSDTSQLGDITVRTTARIVALTPITGVFMQGESIELSSKCVMKVE